MKILKTHFYNPKMVQKLPWLYHGICPKIIYASDTMVDMVFWICTMVILWYMKLIWFLLPTLAKKKKKKSIKEHYGINHVNTMVFFEIHPDRNQ